MNVLLFQDELCLDKIQLQIEHWDVLALFVADTHWCNPQFRVKLHDTDEDDEKMCSFIIQLMQKDRRKMKNKGERLVFIGFVIYRVSVL